jgi:uncharacterized protein
MSNNRKKIWIDLDNTPHVPFFKPIITELGKLGYDVVTTARDCFQVCPLADYHKISYIPIGRHYGKNMIFKGIGLIWRAFQMFPFVIRQKPVLALSHGSRSQLLLSTIWKIPSILIDDYEYSTYLPFLKIDTLFLPDVIPDEKLSSFVGTIKKYPGIKEDVYAPSFEPSQGIREELGIDSGDIMILVRPPATEAHYHNTQSEELFKFSIERYSSVPGTRLVLLPRNKRQEKLIRNLWPDLFASQKVIIPDRVYDGLDLIWSSDLVISGGGTMNREAAALGVPVYSIFRGDIGAVDRYLADQGRLTLLENTEDMQKKVLLRHRDRDISNIQCNNKALRTVVENIISVVEGGLR